MKAKELMIGDWVQFANSSKICSHINCISPYQRHAGHTDNATWFDSFDDIEPIPLTEEILKQNGFEDKSDKARYGNVFYGLEHGRICITYEVDNGLPILTIEDTNDRSKEHNVICLKDEIYNVHELQHALRLCGLNELADNFKIE